MKPDLNPGFWHSSLFANIAAQRLQGCHVLSIVPVPEEGGDRYWQQKYCGEICS